VSVRFARFSGEKVVQLTPEQGLCVSSFLLVRENGALLFGKVVRPDVAKGKWVLPASQLKYGEHPEASVRRIVDEQLGTEVQSVTYRGLWSFAETHWDLCFVYDVTLKGEPRPISEAEATKYPHEYFYSSQWLAELKYVRPEELRPEEIGRGHADVLRAVGILPA
jgi:ADP-ribose pyrophosphatase YjhB (NUDIX family)